MTADPNNGSARNGDRFVKTRTATSMVIALMVTIIAFIARETYAEFKALVTDVRSMVTLVATINGAVGSHEKRLDKIELDLYLPAPHPGGPKERGR